jgi:LPXTG-site transpeptidase (sortase) family protein
MHISVSHHSAAPKISLSDKVWQFVRFSVVTGMIFSMFFFLINFEAYKTIFESVFNPEAQANAEQVLETAATGKSAGFEQGSGLEALPTKREVLKSFEWIDTPIAPTDNRVIIPKIGKSIPLVTMGIENITGENWTELEKQIQKGLQKGVVHYPGTANPGQFGNVFVTGHSSFYPWDPGQFKDVFALLSKLNVDDRFYIYYDQIKYEYVVREKFEVQPSNVSVLEQPKDKKMATLMTCTPVGTTLRRLIIKAEEV